jgi:hypothetical protein
MLSLARVFAEQVSRAKSNSLRQQVATSSNRVGGLVRIQLSGRDLRESDGTFVVLVDWRTNLRDEVLQDTVFHEMCHVATWRQEDDPHGSAFRACMAGIKGKALPDRSRKAR